MSLFEATPTVVNTGSIDVDMRSWRQRRFESAEEPTEVLTHLREAFHEADQDGNGGLDLEEIAQVFQRSHRTVNKLARSRKVVEAEVKRSFGKFDIGNKGRLSLPEFVNMFCASEEFNDPKVSILFIQQQQHIITAGLQSARAPSKIHANTMP